VDQQEQQDDGTQQAHRASMPGSQVGGCTILVSDSDGFSIAKSQDDGQDRVSQDAQVGQPRRNLDHGKMRKRHRIPVELQLSLRSGQEQLEVSQQMDDQEQAEE